MASNQHDPSPTDVFDDSDTLTLNFHLGARVQCAMGDLKNVEGVVAGTRSGGRVLVRVAKGVFIEVARVSLRDAPQKH